MTAKDNSDKRPPRKRISPEDKVSKRLSDKAETRKPSDSRSSSRFNDKDRDKDRPFRERSSNSNREDSSSGRSSKSGPSRDYDRKPSGDDRGKKPYEPRKDSRFGDKDRPFRERPSNSDRDNTEFKDRSKSGPSRDYDRKPSGDDRGKKPYEPRKDSRFGDKDRPFRERPSNSDRDNTEFKDRSKSGPLRDYDRKPSGDDRGKKPYEPRKDSRFGDKDRPFRERPSNSDRDNTEFKDRSKSGPSRDYDRKPSGDDRGKKPYEPRKDSRFGDKDRPKSGGYDRKDRNEKPPYKKTEGRDWERKDSDFKPRSEKASTPEKSANQPDVIRLNKYLADAGVCSRREADVLIEAGTVTVNGKVVTELGTKVSIHDKVVYGDQALKRERLRYVLLNKPKGYITTSDDPYERKTVMELVTNACNERIYPVGRLDRNTLGLLLLTNDGELAKKLMHPKHGVKKLYHVELDRPLTKNHLLEIAAGLELEDGVAQVDGIAYVLGKDGKNEIGIEIHSGKNRIVRRIFEHFDYKVVKLDRVMYASLTKLNLTRGRWRHLTSTEISVLKSIK